MDYKQIEGYPNYIIFKTCKIFSKKSNIFMKPQIQTNKKTGRKEYRIHLYKNAKQKELRIHRLLGLEFIYNDDPINKIQIDHIDRNSLNNDLSNLRWVTIEEQQKNKRLYKRNKLGLRYIMKTKNNTYRVKIPKHKYYKTYKTEEEAILQRNMFLDFMGEDYLNIDK